MKFQQNRFFVLASGSPRRKEYFERYQFDFRIQTADIDESNQAGEEPLAFVKRLAQEKALAVLASCDSNEIVIAADTIVVFEDQILGKPADQQAVLPMLETLNGKSHQVITAFAILDCRNQDLSVKAITTDVEFRQVSQGMLQAYAASTDPLDKAGSYSIQGHGTFLVKSIHGSHNNVVGLPIEVLIEDFLRLGYLTPSW